MKLQIALDMFGLDEALAILDDVGDAVDIVEVGTPWIIREGLKNVTLLKKRFPGLEILADTKIMDAGRLEAADAFAAGADIVTAMGAAYDETIAGAVEAAEKAGGKIMVDLLAVADPAARAVAVRKLGARYACVHTAFDIQHASDPLEELTLVSAALGKTGVAVAGGVKPETLAAIAACGPDIVIVGGALTGAASGDRRKIATAMKAVMNNG